MKKHLITLAVVLAASNLAFAAGDVALTDAQVEAAFKKADPDNDGTVSLAEAKRFGLSKAAFEHANPDKDGTLDKKEFVAAVTWQFHHANPDQDGTLDHKEAKTAGVKSEKVFEEANPDKDGTLDLAEYLQALTVQAK